MAIALLSFELKRLCYYLGAAMNDPYREEPPLICEFSSIELFLPSNWSMAEISLCLLVDMALRSLLSWAMRFIR